MSNRVIVSVDVEDWYHGPTVISAQDKANSLETLLASGKDIERANKYIGACLDLLGTYGVKGTFFWVAEYARRFPALVREVVDQGHEVACHGLSHYSKLDKNTKHHLFTESEFAARTVEAKDILENLAGSAVIGYRAPNAYISGTMLDVLEQLGFRYDSSVSVNSLYNKTDSRLHGVTTTPYYPIRGTLDRGGEKRGIVEFPWPYLEVFGFKQQSAGGPFLRLFGANLVRAGIRQSLRRGHTVFYFHPIDICNEPVPIGLSVRGALWHLKGDMVKRRVAKVLDAYAGVATNFVGMLDEAVNQR